MQFSEYQKKSRETAMYPKSGGNFIYPSLGLAGEAGEVCNKIKKFIRDDNVSTPEGVSEEKRKEISQELGDVLWYLAQLATELDLSLDSIATENIEKLQYRLERGALKGEGDKR